MRLIQVCERTGEVLRVKEGETPVVEMHLEDYQSIVGFELRPRWQVASRKTVDWDWSAYVLTALPVELGEEH